MAGPFQLFFLEIGKKGVYFGLENGAYIRPLVIGRKGLEYVFLQTVKAQMKCHIMQHFTRVYTIC